MAGKLEEARKELEQIAERKWRSPSGETLPSVNEVAEEALKEIRRRTRLTDEDLRRRITI